MYCRFVLFASFFLCEVSAEAEPIERIIKDYFNSESVRRFRKEWESHRKPIEHAILTALKETVGLPEMNVYIKRVKEKLVGGYLHSDNQVRLTLSEIDLEAVPRCVLADVQLSLASNVLKIRTSLTKMIIHADYSLIRNKSDIIHDPKIQNPLTSSPFLFEQVLDVGKVAITMESCTLLGFIMTILNGESVNLGYDHFKLYNCKYTLEIYRPGEDSPPVITQYELDREQGLGIKHFLMKPLVTEELVPKLQAAMFSFINTSALFGEALQEYRENQEIVLQATAQHFTKFVRNLNRLTVEKNHGTIEMEDYTVYWDDGTLRPTKENKYTAGESIMLTDMVLTGLDTIYATHCGGPIKLENISITDKIRFSSLQVQGILRVTSMWSDTFSFVAEISDWAVDLQMGQSQRDKGNRRDAKGDRAGLMKFEVTGFKRMVFTVPSLIFASTESLVTGYLINEVPKVLRSHLLSISSQAITITKVFKPSVDKDRNSDDSKMIIDDDDSAETDPKSESIVDGDDYAETDPKSESIVDGDDSAERDSKSESMPLTDSEDQEYHELKGKRKRDVFKKNKKRFMSANGPRRRRLRRHGSRKRVLDNQIRKR